MFSLKRRVYLDYNATTPVRQDVQTTMRRVLRRFWGNPSSACQPGKIAARIIEESREKVARAIAAPSHEVYFTSCATESNNAVLKSLSAHFYPGKKKIISTPVEHPSVIQALEFLKTTGIEVEYCMVDRYGRVDTPDLARRLDSDTFLVCCMLANNENGTIQDLRHISTLARERGILILSDCVQALGKIRVDVKALGVDYASFSAHKIYGPKGIGALYARINSPQVQLLHGGGQEEGLRAGTESVHNIAGFATACRHLHEYTSQADRIMALKNTLTEGILNMYPKTRLNSPSTDCLPNTISITFPGQDSGELMRILDANGICVSSGSACSSRLRRPSHVLKAIGLDDQASLQTIRISLGRKTTNREIKYFLSILKRYFV